VNPSAASTKLDDMPTQRAPARAAIARGAAAATAGSAATTATAATASAAASAAAAATAGGAAAITARAQSSGAVELTCHASSAMSLAEQAAAHPFLAAFMPRDVDAHASLDSVLAGQAAATDAGTQEEAAPAAQGGYPAGEQRRPASAEDNQRPVSPTSNPNPNPKTLNLTLTLTLTPNP